MRKIREMTKLTFYTLTWSEHEHVYKLVAEGGGTLYRVQQDKEQWRKWLDE